MPEGITSDSVFFEGFQEGEFGTQGPWIVGWGLYRQHLYYKGWWTGQNVVKYVDGSVGPRSGLVALGVTGLPNGKLNGLGYAPTPAKSGWCVIGSALYMFDAEATGSAAVHVGDLSVAPTRPITSVLVGQYTYITNYGDQTYAYNAGAGTLAAITNSPGGTCITAYLDRLIVGCTSTAGNIIWYSDPAPATGGPFTWAQIAARTVTDAVLTAGSATIQSATANFSSATDDNVPLAADSASFTTLSDGTIVANSDLPNGVTIASVTDSTHAVMSSPSLVTATGVTITIGVGNLPWQSEYIYVGDQWEVRSLSALRTGLAISKQDGSWWMLTGTPGVNDVLRRVQGGESLGPIWPHRTALCGDQNVWNVPYGADYPGYFSGAKAANIKYLSFMGGAFTDDGAQHVDVGIAPIFQPDEFLAVSGNPASPNTALLRRNGIFCKHLFSANVSGWVAQGNTGRMLLSDGGATGAPPVMYAFRASGIERPNVIGNNLESVGDASTTPLAATISMPEWLERSGGLVLVREVIVEFKSYNTGASANNHFDLTVTSTRRPTQPANMATPTPDQVSKVYPYDEAGSAIGSTGAVKNRTMKFTTGDMGRGGGYFFTLANLKGVAITRIVVHLQTEPATV